MLQVYTYIYIINISIPIISYIGDGCMWLHVNNKDNLIATMPTQQCTEALTTTNARDTATANNYTLLTANTTTTDNAQRVYDMIQQKVHTT